MSLDPLAFAQALIRRPSVTPADEGALDLVQGELEKLGFACLRLKFEEVDNLYARRGHQGPNLCFAGHTDVVPAGDTAAWRHGPFEGEVKDGVLHGRGAADMKGGIAAWIAALSRVLAEQEPKGSLSLLITGDEEGPALNGTKKVVQALLAEGEVIDHCVVGEPTSAAVIGDQFKIGRRGSLNATITLEGRQGHVAYPDRAANPIPELMALLGRLQARRLAAFGHGSSLRAGSTNDEVRSTSKDATGCGLGPLSSLFVLRRSYFVLPATSAMLYFSVGDTPTGTPK